MKFAVYCFQVGSAATVVYQAEKTTRLGWSAKHGDRGARKSTPPFGRLMTKICGVGRIFSPGGFCGDGGVSNRKDHPSRVVFLFGAPSGTRTQGPLIKSQLLYQLS